MCSLFRQLSDVLYSEVALTKKHLASQIMILLFIDTKLLNHPVVLGCLHIIKGLFLRVCSCLRKCAFLGLPVQIDMSLGSHIAVCFSTFEMRRSRSISLTRECK